MKERASQQPGNGGSSSQTLPPPSSHQHGGSAGPLLGRTASQGKKTAGKGTKKVKFSSPPKWRAKHSLSGLKSGAKARQPLQTLQSHATNPRLLVGSGSPRQRSIGKPVKKKEARKEAISLVLSSSESDASSATFTSDTTTSSEKSFSDKEIQTDPESSSLGYQMVASEQPPPEYWKVLAEQRREALAETLQENEELYEEVRRLKARIAELEEKADSGEYFAMMYRVASEGCGTVPSSLS